MVNQQIVSALQKIVKDIAGLDIIPQLEYPSDESHGDYSSNIALILGKKLKKNPLELAQQIVDSLNTKYLIHNTARVDVVAPGFINFYLSKEYLVDQLEAATLLSPPAGGFGGQRKIMVEYTDPNPFKEFHIGHLYSNTVGESLCRILESQGGEVRRVCYQGDVGLHVAKAVYGLQVSSIKYQVLSKEPLEKRIKALGEAYAAGAKAYEESEKAKEEINQINKKVYEKSDPEINSLYEKGREWSLEYFETIYKRLGTKFEGYYFESEVGKIGMEFVKKHMDIFEESEGAVIFPGEKYGLHTRVFINKLGLPTYEAKELGLAPTKYKDFPYDQSIIITGNEINAYFQVLLKALSFIDADLAAKTKHIGHGMVRLPTGKMSSRTGDVITGEWLLDEAKRRILKQFKEMDSKTAEKVAVGAVKYALLKSGIGRDISFSFDESISLEGNSGPYLQYTYARTQSVLGKVKSQKSKVKTTIQNAKLNSEEVALLRIMHRFPEVIAEACQTYSPSTICTYLFKLAQNFNLFYQKCPILESENKDFRLKLTEATGQVIKNGLNLLSIQAPKRM